MFYVKIQIKQKQQYCGNKGETSGMALSSPLSLTLLNRTSSLNNPSLGVIKSYNVLPFYHTSNLSNPSLAIVKSSNFLPFYHTSNLSNPSLSAIKSSNVLRFYRTSSLNNPSLSVIKFSTSFPYIAHLALTAPHYVLSLADSTIVGQLSGAAIFHQYQLKVDELTT